MDAPFGERGRLIGDSSTAGESYSLGIWESAPLDPDADC